MRFRCQMPDARCQMPDARCQMPDAGCQMPDARYKLFVSYSFLLVNFDIKYNSKPV